MHIKFIKITLLISLIAIILGFSSISSVQAEIPNQQPTGSIPTVTGTPSGPTARVNFDNDQINLRSGPGTNYDIVGFLVSGEVVPVFGRSLGGDWVQVYYPGTRVGVAWVYSPLITMLQGGDLTILEPPATSTPRITPTIDPTLAAQFIQDIPATRLPTFTSAPPLIVPTLDAAPVGGTGNNFPMGLVILIFGFIGIMGSVFSFLRGR